MRLITVLLLLSIPHGAFAQSPVIPMEGPAGEPGLWMPEDVAREALERATAAAMADERARLYKAQAEAQAARGDALERAEATATEATTRAREELARVRRQRDRANTRASRRLRAAWGSGVAGVLLGALLGVLAAR